MDQAVKKLGGHARAASKTEAVRRSVAYAALARYLGLGSFADVAGDGGWTQLVDYLGLMCLYFLNFDAHHAARTRGLARR